MRRNCHAGFYEDLTIAENTSFETSATLGSQVTRAFNPRKIIALAGSMARTFQYLDFLGQLTKSAGDFAGSGVAELP